MNLREYLKNNRLAADGAFGTYYADKYGSDELPEAANILHPDRVIAIHTEYINAGARYIRTNTYASNSNLLSDDENKVKENITAAVQLAQEAVKSSGVRQIYIAGDIGPIPDGMGFVKNGKDKEYVRLASIMLEQGVDAVHFETFADYEDILPAIKYLRESSSDIFISICFSVNQYGYSAAGLSAKRLIEDAAKLAVDAVGLNCGVGSGHMSQLIDELGLPKNKFFLALPNAGYPNFTRNHMHFGGAPAYFAGKMAQIAKKGVDIVGGCCGTRPESIEKMCTELEKLPRYEKKTPDEHTDEPKQAKRKGFLYRGRFIYIKEEHMSKELSKTYDPKDIEDRLYKKWEDNGYFHAEADRSKKPFTIVMPPPNITGQLHMGHALDNTMQDILIRYKRMQGYNALWQPGTDHAAIATEVKVIDSLKKQGIDKNDLGREGFLEKCWEWKDEYGSRIINQLKKMGSSADWSRERFTMDKGCSDAVLEVFIKLYEKGLIYKGSRIVNWCPVCKTSISDAEVEHEEQDGFFWHINYPVVGEAGRFVEIATTRPETLFGDTAVAVNPDDERYQDIIGKMLKLPMTDREIPVIADSYVDKEFGTGCVKITPAHDPNDFEVGKRHNLEEIVVINDDATMNSKAGKYAGMDRYECRKALVEDLEKEGLLVKVVPHSHNVGTHDRCGTTVEPMIKQQWFVKMDPLAGPAIDAVENGDIKFVPERFKKNYRICSTKRNFIFWNNRI